MATHREALLRFAEKNGIAPDDFLRVYLHAHIAPNVSVRYWRLVAEVLWRLPEGWDTARAWSVEVSPKTDPKGYASAQREEEGEGEVEQLWTVTLYPALLEQLSDAACRWAIAHEFGHVASGLPMGSIVIGGKPMTKMKGTNDEYEEASSKDDQEHVAEKIALEWGFSGELMTFLADEEKESQ